MNRHPLETDLALYAGDDLRGMRLVWKKMRTALHVRRCTQCLAAVDAYRMDQQELIDTGAQLPAGLKWDRLAAEMTANIHLGLAAGECVSPAAPVQKPLGLLAGWNWRPAAAVAGLTLVFGAAWALNMGDDLHILVSRLDSIVHGKMGAPEEYGSVVEASSKGAKLRENGDVLELSVGDVMPIFSTASLDGSASSRFVDSDTFQVTIAAVRTQ